MRNSLKWVVLKIIIYTSTVLCDYTGVTNEVLLPQTPKICMEWGSRGVWTTEVCFNLCVWINMYH